MIKYIIILCGFLFISCSTTYFTKVKKIKALNSIKDFNGFINLKNDNLVINKIKYKRFLLKKSNRVLIDGYWSTNIKDTIFFIPYHSILQNCDDKLIFFIDNKKESYWVGQSCIKDDSFNMPINILVSNLNNNNNNNNNNDESCFTHSIISKDDYKNQDDSILVKRYYSINLSKGIKLDSTIVVKDDYFFNY